MRLRRLFYAVLFAFGYLSSTKAQEAPIPQLSRGWACEPAPAPAVMFPDALSSPQSIKLSVPEGTPLQVALVDETRVKKVGQPICAIVVGPVYAFDRLVVPVGSQVTGHVTKIEAISGASAQSLRWTQTLALRKVEVSFNETSAAGRKAGLRACCPIVPSRLLKSQYVLSDLVLANHRLAHSDIADLQDRVTQESIQIEDEIQGEMH